jgi:hypothetical protein
MFEIERVSFRSLSGYLLRTKRVHNESLFSVWKTLSGAHIRQHVLHNSGRSGTHTRSSKEGRWQIQIEFAF